MRGTHAYLAYVTEQYCPLHHILYLVSRGVHCDTVGKSLRDALCDQCHEACSESPTDGYNNSLPLADQKKATRKRLPCLSTNLVT